MIAPQLAEPVEGVQVCTDSNVGLHVTVDGHRARLAILDEDGRLVASGDSVEGAVQEAVVTGYQRFLESQGWLRVVVHVPHEAGPIKGGRRSNAKAGE